MSVLTSNESNQGQVCLDNLPLTGCTEDDIKNYFSQYGSIVEIVWDVERRNMKHKNFCFVTFGRENIAYQLIAEGSADIGGHKINIKKVS